MMLQGTIDPGEIRDDRLTDNARPAAPVARLGEQMGRLRLSTRGRLTLGVLLSALPLYALAVGLAWRTPVRGWVVAGGLLIVLVGLVTTAWAYRPVARLADRARRLAGMSAGSRRALGLVRAAMTGDQMVALALDEIEQSLQEIQALNRIGQMVASSNDLADILRAIAEEAVGLLGADSGIIGLWDEERQVFRDVAACNLPIMFPGREFGICECLSSQVAHTKQVIFVDDYMQYPLRLEELDPFELRAGVGVPLMVGEACKGSLVVHTLDPERRFSGRDGELLLTFASQAAAAFEKARLYQLALDQLEALTRAQEALAHESHELEQALSNMVRVQEEERGRIAADVHDGVVQMMVGSLCELQAAMAHFPADPPMVDLKHERARDLIRDSITELRRVIFDLRPITLDAAGLVPAVESMKEDLERAAQARFSLLVSGSPSRFAPEIEIGAYRIVQEAVNNAVKHAGASTIQVELCFGAESLGIVVRDDGHGFSVEEAGSIYGQHAGLIGMKERARSLGGRLTVWSELGQGTTVQADIPCLVATRRQQASSISVPAADPLSQLEVR